MEALGEAVVDILEGQVLARQELTETVVARCGLEGMGEHCTGRERPLVVRTG
ncbi:hypothetical protein AB0I10_17205 [Streptomyces sp. NPDC050636]|uniref:hypothetical protein n=1 Tax=Streptomyces sp. NPDC050636 TaxID=3154510 RepID=UPI00343FA4E5